MIEYVARQVDKSSVLWTIGSKEHLQPMLKSRHQPAAPAGNRKIAVLQNALIAILETRLPGGGLSVNNERSEKEGSGQCLWGSREPILVDLSDFLDLCTKQFRSFLRE
jgi:hypothetical protein